MQNPQMAMQQHQAQQQQQQQQQQQFITSSGHVHLAANTAMCLQQHQQQQQKATHKQTITAHISTNNILKLNTDIEQHQQSQHQQQQQQQQQQQFISCQANASVFNHPGISNTTIDCDYKNCQQFSANNIGMSNSGRRMQCGPMSSARALETHNLLQRYVTASDVELSHGFHALSSANFVDANAASGSSGIIGSCNDFELIASPTQFANSSSNSLAHLSGSVSTPTLDMLPPPPPIINSSGIATISANTSDSVTQTVLTGIGSGHHTLPTHHSQISKNNKDASTNPIVGGTLGSRTSSSAKKFQRNIPRYLISGTESSANNSSKESGNSQNLKITNEFKSSANSSNASSGSSSQSNAKKLTCQCPVQHVPMSYMGNQILATNTGNGSATCNPAFISALSNKLVGTTSASSTTSSSTPSSMRSSLGSQTTSRARYLVNCEDNQFNSANNSRASGAKKSTQQQQQQQYDSVNSSPSTFNKIDSKISTISKQVADVSPELSVVAVGHHHHHNYYHKHHHNTQTLSTSPVRNEESGPIVLGRVHKKGNSDRHRSSSGGSSRCESESNANSLASSGSYLGAKSDSCYYDQQQQAEEMQHQKNDTLNPLLPPKLHKSLTNLKPTTNTSLTPRRVNASSNSSNQGSSKASNKIQNSEKQSVSHKKVTSATTAVQTSHTQGKALKTTSTISATSKIATSTGSRKDYQDSKNVQPSLTLPPASPSLSSSMGNAGGSSMYLETTGNSTASGEKGANKINSSTFYPLQNNHATYTLPKHITGKVSLNSTIASVVSKVPSVISIPVSSSSTDTTNNNPAANKLNDLNQQHHAQQSQASGSTASISNGNPWKCTTLPKSLRTSKQGHRIGIANHASSKAALHSKLLSMNSKAALVSSCNAAPSSYSYQFSNSAITTSLSKSLTTNTATATLGKHLPVCTTSKNCFNPKEHFLPNDTSLDDDYLSECENCKTAHSAKYYLNVEESESTPQETMTLQRKLIDDAKDEQDSAAYYRNSHTLPTNSKKNTPIKNNNREPSWFSTIPASSSSDEDANQ